MMRLLFCLMLSCVSLSLPAQKSRNQKPEQPEGPTIEENMAAYRFEAACRQIDDELATLKRKRRLTAEQTARKAWLEAQRAEAEFLQPKVEATRRVTFIDSIVVAKSEMLEHIALSDESGTLSTYARTFHATDTLGCTVYQAEMGHDAYFAAPTADGTPQLFKSSFTGKRWSKAEALAGLEGDSCQNHPFMLADGITLYYSAINEDEGLGGYDIYSTRWNVDDKHFMQPENLGFPFSSQANDYLMAIDELNQLGWFVTDRCQAPDSVCIYVFIPETVRRNWLDTGVEPEQLGALARIADIASTQINMDEVEAARKRLADVRKGGRQKSVVWDFTFVMNDSTVCHSLADFRNPATRALAEQWQKAGTDLRAAEAQLELMRSQYAKANDSRRSQMRSQLLTLEREHERLIAEVRRLEKEMRASSPQPSPSRERGL